MSLAPFARFSFVAELTGLLIAVALFGAGGCSLNTAGIGDPGPVTNGTGGNGSESRGGIGGFNTVLTGSGGSTADASTGAGGAGGSGSGGAPGAGGTVVTGSGGTSDGAGGTQTGAGGATDGTGGMQTGAGGMNNGMGGAGMGGAGMGGAGMGGSGMGGAGTGGRGMGGAPGMGGMQGTGGMIVGGTGGVSVIGCADGSREAFVNVNTFPSIAGCAGGWSVPGVVSAASMNPACNRAGGNDGTKPNGNGCSVADLCAVGWHVCAGATELTTLKVTCAQAGIPNDINNNVASRLLYATRQRGVTGSVCNANDMIGTNDVHGCGNFGLAEDPNCAPLNDQFSHTECDEVPPWSCDGTLATTEGLIVVKPGPTGGGALCCKN